MKDSFSEITSEPFHLVLYHVGGGNENIGPSSAIVEAFPSNTLLVVFEVRTDSDEPIEVRRTNKNGPCVVSVNRLVGSKREVRPFYINKDPLSSSLFKGAPIAKNDDPGYRQTHRWGENTELESEIEASVWPLDAIVEELSLPKPDFVSVDAQGAELKILHGAERSFSESVVGALTEIEFSEIYSGQPLFDEQMAWYSQKGMRLVEIFTQQRWHPGPRMPGQAFLTVGEALFIKYVHDFDENEQRPNRAFVELEHMSGEKLLKIMAVALAFNMNSYAVKIGQYIADFYPETMELACSIPKLKESVDMAKFVVANFHEYEKDRDFFLKTNGIEQS